MANDTLVKLLLDSKQRYSPEQARQLAGLDRRRAVQEALLKQAIAGTPTNATSWAQVFAPIVQGLLAGRMSKGIDRDALTIGQAQQTSAEQARADLFAARQNGDDIETLIRKFGNNPYLTDDLKELRQAWGARMSNAESGHWVNGRYLRAGDYAEGTGARTEAPVNDAIGWDQSGAPQLNQHKMVYDTISGAAASGNPYSAQEQEAILKQLPGHQEELPALPAAPQAPASSGSPNEAPLGTVQHSPSTGRVRVMTQHGWVEQTQ